MSEARTRKMAVWVRAGRGVDGGREVDERKEESQAGEMGRDLRARAWVVMKVIAAAVSVWEGWEVEGIFG